MDRLGLGFLIQRFDSMWANRASREVISWVAGLALGLALLISPFISSFATAGDSWQFPGSELEKKETHPVAMRAVYLSAPKRVSNELRFERVESVQASLETSLYRLPDGTAIDQAFAFYKKRFTETGELMYSCEHRACGTSTNWANKVFEVAKLTGRDDNQFYLASRTSEGWVTAYIVRNGRRQGYVYFQLMADVSPGLEDKRAESSSNDEVLGVLLDDQSAFTPNTLISLEKMLREKKDDHLVVQVFVPMGESLAQFQQNQSQVAKLALKQLKSELGVPESRIFILVSGGLGDEIAHDQVRYRYSLLQP